MTILLTKDLRVGGVVLASGTTQTFAADLEADIVARKGATYLTDPTPGKTVPVVATTDVTGGSVLSAGGTVVYDAIDIRGFGAKCDGQCVTNAVIASLGGGLYSVTSASALFLASDVGKVAAAISVAAGVQFGYNCIVTAYTSPTVITVSSSNGAIVSAGSRFVWGTNDYDAFVAAVAYAGILLHKKNVFIPQGITTIKNSTTITLPDGVGLVGSGNTNTVSKTGQYSGSVLALTGYIASGAFIAMGTSLSSGIGATCNNVTIDSMHLASNSSGNQRPVNYSKTTFLRGRVDLPPSGVVDNCVFSQQFQDYSLKMQGDSRCVNSYLFGAAVNQPNVQIVSSDNLFSGNHLWRDGGAYLGPLVKIDIFGTALDGAININLNQFDTPVGACIELNVGAAASIRTLNIIGNTSFSAAAVDTNSPSAVINGTITGGTTLTVNSLTSGTVYVGATLNGGGVTAGVKILSQSSGTPGGAGVYVIQTSANVGPVSINCYGFPYIKLNVNATGVVRCLNVTGNTGHGAFDDVTKGRFACFIDGTGMLGTVAISNIVGNTIDDCGVGYSRFTPSNSSNNFLLVNSASTTPVAF
jgi:hypothetical protein